MNPTTHPELRYGRHAWRFLAVGAVVLSTGLALSTPAFAAKKAKAPTDPYLTADLKAPGGTLTGAGSTFDQPFFTKAFYTYNKQNSGVTINYASIGSGGGIAQFQANTVNFGASDVPMTPADIAGAKGGQVLQVPVDLGGEAISYNLPGIKTGLKLTPAVLADIFLGKITTWDDPAIKKLNPKLKLPSQKITTVHRADGSGTTYIFTDYLSNVSPDWKAGPGAGKSVNWPNGVAGQGNEGVAGAIQQTPYSVGYVELAYALQNNFTYAAIKNADGKYVLPSKASVAADAAQKPNITSVDFSIVNQAGAASYPISGYSWALIYQLQKDQTAGTTLVKVLDWLSHAPGQAIAGTLDYVPLPANIQALARTTLLQVTGPNGTTVLLTK
ncbi:MAG TPA: phosphate ABC transporter substrate-binding protein PstS [Acidimicrobiales bacterium]|nr:phosphate ABC transporter substrate-binding protein PstS [Acidimicrobiales bacterium]